MRENPVFAMTDVGEAKALIRSAPWATLVSATDDGPLASHYPVLLDQTDPQGFTLVSHVGRPDEVAHGLGDRELLVIFSGPHGYISPGWYGVGAAVPTWNFTAVHAWGRPELLSDEQNLEVLDRLVDAFEDALPEPFRMRRDVANADYAERIVRGTVGFRMRVERWVGKRKLSQNQPAEIVERVIAALRAPGPYEHPALADGMAAQRIRSVGQGNDR